MKLALWSGLAAGILVSSAALAQDPDAKEILKKVDTTTKELKAVSYNATIFGEGALKDQMGKTKSTVIAKKIGDERFLARVEAVIQPSQDGAKREMTMIVGEKDGISLDGVAKTYTSVDGDTVEAFAAQAMNAGMLEYVHATPFTDEINADERKYEGKKTIGGVECHVILVTYAGGMGESRWYFGVKDNLPRRVDRIQKTDDGVGARVTELSDLNTTPKIDDKTFATAAPDGFKKAEPRRAGTRREPEATVKEGDAAPEWTLETPEGKKVSLVDLKGKIVVLDFWATWCGPCKRAMPGVQKLHDEFKDKGVVVYGISTWERDGDPAKYMKDNKYTYGLLVKGDEVAEKYKVSGIPTFYVIGRDGKVLMSASGFSEDNDKKLHEILAAQTTKKE